MSNPFPMHEGARCPDKEGKVCTGHAWIHSPTREELQAELEALTAEAEREDSSPMRLVKTLNRIDAIETVLDDMNYKDAAMYYHMERSGNDGHEIWNTGTEMNYEWCPGAGSVGDDGN